MNTVTLIEALPGMGTLEEIVRILFCKPVIDFAGAPMELRGHRTFFKLTGLAPWNLQLATFSNNRVARFAPTAIEDIIAGFKYLKGDKIKTALKGFQVTIT